jgi:ubiquinone/menaquinone biosynthesis C-methylase UbiE
VLRELAHVFVGARETLALRRRLPQVEFFDLIMQRADAAGMAEHRRALATGLKGRVLEIGCGTGLMFPHYHPDAQVLAIEPNEEHLPLARRRAAEARCTITIETARAEALPTDGASFDAVVCALVLCSVANVPEALREIARVMKRDAELRLIEHVRSEKPLPGALMRVFDPLWVALNGQGCHMARDTERQLQSAGFELVDTVAFQLFAPGLPAFPMRRMRACPRG